jgi:hypothetical protein
MLHYIKKVKHMYSAPKQYNTPILQFYIHAFKTTLSTTLRHTNYSPQGRGGGGNKIAVMP